ncbi:MAG: DEAD/DEAH box helicase family protein, partial [Bacteriovoracaceae bacterium]|nr:DEAD/DEAH box helicase family protein [Bacteriovoracaceae bacterium]
MELLTVGQRFISETEPELGLGILTVIEAKTITVFYPASDTTRKYGIKSAPLKRARFGVGDIISSVDNLTIEVEHITPFEGLIIYRGTDGQEILESELTGALSYSKPEERLFNGLIDSNELFKLRFETHLLHKQTLLSPVRGFIGGRISLISHQLYLAQEVAKRPIPRALLADEVGLGKTIEAGLILHHLYKTGRIERVLILVPDSLVHQWFVEMLRRFQIAFCVINQETHFDPEINPFKYHQLVICNMGLFKGSKVAQNLLEQAQWDMLIVDEAHQLSWSEELVSFEYELVQKIASKSLGLILLTATPEQLGQSGHFARLKLLDPHRFNNYQQFLAENEDYEKVAKKGLVLVENNCSATDDQARSKLQHLLDIHGTGRVFFRNTRNTMEKTFHFFPKRILNSYALLTDKAATVIRGNQERAGSTTFNLRMDWLVQFLHKHLGQKVLLISTSKDKIISIEKALRHRTSKVVASVFHSGLTLMARDRQVAYFAEPGGADLLLCTEVGSEGRNFEFVSHLVLFDLPLNPDLLEQRIGRLDRIGQKRDIHIHVPYIQNSYEEILFHWYHEGLDAFNAPVKGAQA